MTDEPVSRDQATVRAGDAETLDNLGYGAGGVPAPRGVKPVLRPVAADPAAEEGEYVVLDLIGRGGMGEVYAARHLPTDRLVALKVARRGDDGDQAQRLLWEAQATAKLEHPGIVPVHDIGYAGAAAETPALGGNQPFYAMRMLPDGRTWDSLIRTLPFRENIEILLRVADAIRYAHSRNILHRDLKPANVMLGDFGEVFVMDWGLAVSLGEAGKEGTLAKPLVEGEAHSFGLSLGTPAYTAPELAGGDVRRIGPATDIYLLGAILFEILAGVPPHGEGDNGTLLRSALRNDVAWDRVPPKSRELAAIAARAMRGEPAERHADVGEFQSALRDWLRRSDAAELAAKAAEELALARARESDPVPNAAYAAFENARGLLVAARELTPDHHGIAGLQLELDNAHAAFALARGDLDLAQSRLPADGGDGLTERLRADIVAERTRRRQRVRRYRVFRAFLAVAVGVALVLLLAAAYQANRAKRALWDLSDRLYANGITSGNAGHDRESENSFAEALHLFRQLGRDATAPALALREVKNRNIPSRVVPSALDAAIAADAPAQAWVFAGDGGTAVCLALSGAVGVDVETGEAAWRWSAPEKARGTWTVSAAGRTALFVPSRPAREFFLLELDTGGETRLAGDGPGLDLAKPRFAVADDGTRWFMAGRNAADEWVSYVFEKRGNAWMGDRLRFARDLDCAQFLDARTLFLSAPPQGDRAGKHLLVRKREEGWRLAAFFGDRLGNPVQSALLSRDGRHLVISYVRPPAAPRADSRESDAAENRARYFPSGTVEEWRIDGDAPPRLTGRGRRYPERRLAGLGRWLDIAYGNGGWPKSILFNANAADGLVSLLYLPEEGAPPQIRRRLTADNYRYDNHHAYVVAGTIDPGRNALHLGMSDGSLLSFALAVDFERHVRLPVRVDGARPLTALAASADGGRLLFAASTGDFAVVDAESWRILSAASVAGSDPEEEPAGGQDAEHSLLEFVLLDARIAPALPAALNCDGTQAAFSHRHTVVVWDASDPAAIRPLPPCPDTPLALRFADSGGLELYTAEAVYEFSGGVWELRRGLKRVQDDLVTLLHPFAVSKDGTRLLRTTVNPAIESLIGIRQGMADRQVVLEAWDIPGGRRLWSANVVASALAWSADNKLVGVGLSGGGGHMLLDGNTGKTVAVLDEAAHRPATRLAFSPDGKFLAATTVEHQLRVWSVADGLECIRRPFFRTGGHAGVAERDANDPLLFFANGDLAVFDVNGVMRHGASPERVGDGTMGEAEETRPLGLLLKLEDGAAFRGFGAE